MQKPVTLQLVSIDELALPARFKNGIAAAVDIIYKMNIPDFCYVVLFGSCASGALKTSSDIDLLIVTTEKICCRF